MPQSKPQLEVQDDSPSDEKFRADVVAALSEQPRRLPTEYLYDKKGSEIFDAICELPEYYLTRTEAAIIDTYHEEIAAAIGPRPVVIEPGAGSVVKIRQLLKLLEEPVAFIPIDISGEHLAQEAESLAAEFPDLEILPVAADFTATLDLPDSATPAQRRLMFFPGSTIGNFSPEFRDEVLASLAETAGEGAEMLVGIDLQKDPSIVLPAYDDSRGVTASFNMNLLARVRDELGADINPDSFEYHARYDTECQRVEMFVRSKNDQTVRIGADEFALDAGELILTEYSHKFTIEAFAEIARACSWNLREAWTDERGWYGVLLLDRA